MRKLLFVLLLLPLFSIAQDSTKSVEDSTNKLERAYISVAKSRSHGKLVLFTNNYVEETDSFLSWLFNEGHCTSIDDKEGIYHRPK